MSHYTDCTVTEDSLERVEEIAELIWSGGADGFTKAKRIAEEDLGWNHIGGGAGREVFRVNGEQQIGDVTEATHEAPCVIKFAKQSRRYDGQGQNRQEVEMYQKLPSNLTEGNGSPPVFVPVKDYDEGDYHWLSMPEVDPHGGSDAAIQRRLFEAGWDCDDLHMDNIGQMHDESVVLDYGLDCREIGDPTELGEEMAEELRQIGCEGVEVDAQSDGVTVEFYPPGWVLDIPEPETESYVHFRPGEGFSTGEFYFGTWNEEDHSMVFKDMHDTVAGTDIPTVNEAAELAGEELDEQWFGVNVYTNVKRGQGVMQVDYHVEDINPTEMTPPDIVADQYEMILSTVDEHFPGGEIYPAEDDQIDFEKDFSPNRGMVLDHPAFGGEVTVIRANDRGDVYVRAENDQEYNLSRPGYADITPDMVVGEHDFGDADEETIQAELDEVIGQKLREVKNERKRQNILSKIEAEVDEAIEEAELDEAIEAD